MDSIKLIGLGNIRSMMDHFYHMIQIPLAIADTRGKVYAEVGWQEICTNYHRINPVTCGNCIESHGLLTANIPAGEFKLYKCKNGLWELAIPLIINGQVIGNLFIGQFLFEDEHIDYEFFREQALRYGFNEKDYLIALEKVPRISQARLSVAKAFFLEFTRHTSELSVKNIKLAKTVNSLKKAEKLLKHQAFLIDKVSDAIIASDGLFRITYWNKAAETIYGWSAQEVIGLNGPELLNTRFIGVSREEAIQHAEKKGSFKTEVIQQTKNGHQVYIESFFQVTKDRKGKITQFVSVNRDITERKRLESDLRRANGELELKIEQRTKELNNTLKDLEVEKSFFRQVLDMLPVYVIILTPDYQIVFSNKEFQNCFGSYSEKRFFEHLFESDSRSESCKAFSVLQTGLPYFCEWTGPNGRIYQISDFPVTNSDGSQFVVEMGEDITAKKNLQRQIMAKIIEKEETDKKKFASDLHDDLGPILSAIKLQIGILNPGLTEEKQMEIINNCNGLLNEAIDKMGFIANNLLPNLIEHYGIETALASFIRKIKREPEFTVKFNSNLRDYRFDPSAELHIYRIICELLNNTLKHSGAGSADLKLNVNNNKLTIRYSDNGKGYSFSKILPANKGTGLHNILQRINLLNGKMDIVEKYGKTTLTLTINFNNTMHNS